MIEGLFSIPKESLWWAWAVLIMASLGTFLWRGLGVLLSGRLDQNSAFFRWLTCVAYAMVAALVVRIIVLPVGMMVQMPLSLRLIAAGAALAIMLVKKNALVPALLTGTLLTVFFSWLG